MKISIDVSDFYLDEETLENGLQDYVKREVLNEIWKRIEKKVDDYLTLTIKDQVEKTMYQKMSFFIDAYIKEGTVKSTKNNDQVTLEEFVKEKFIYGTGWQSADESIKKLASNFGQEMKNRYDLLFASQIVAKMNETGLLKDDVAKKLLAP